MSPISAYCLEAKDKIIKKYLSVLRDGLSTGLSMAREADHEFKTLDDAKSPAQGTLAALSFGTPSY